MDTSLALSFVPTIYGTTIPPSLINFLKSTEDNADHYPQTLLLLRLLHGSGGNELKFHIQEDLDRGYVENWPVHFNTPKRYNVKCSKDMLTELKLFFEDHFDDVAYVQPRIDKFGRCEVNGQKFSSDYNSTNRGNLVKVMFADTSDDLQPYFGTVKYFFTAKALICGSVTTHHLAYITWFKFRGERMDSSNQLYKVVKEFYQKDRIISPRRFLCRCVLVPPSTSANYSFVSELIK